MGRKTKPRLTLSIDKPIFEKVKIFAISLKESIADRIRVVSGNDSLTKGIKDCLEVTDLVIKLGEGDIIRGRLRLTKMVIKLRKKREAERN
jgi:hypothetical protein